MESIVREEMERAGFCEIQMSLLQDTDLWWQTGRLEVYGDELMRLTSRSGRLFCLGATCEELATNMVKTHYNRTDMSLGLYQFGNKCRDELRTRGGLARAKEFIMKDGYAFNATEDGARAAYEAVREAYQRIFRRLGQAGKKLADAGLIACRQRVVVSGKALASGRFEWMDRRTLAREEASAAEIVALCAR
ncbi:aminoacyl--tRNA ligase-related protein [Paraburkholderia xenovorans]|uniref:aminoacyl--tRNA ligase-related protein n=1 Tax=Paraburkholderia xenovorans TaxID=36873 RepID=UPI0038BBA909